MASDFSDIQRNGNPAIPARLFAWGMLAVLFAFLVNNALIIGFGLPGVKPILSGDTTGGTLINLGVYILSIGAASLYVLRSRETSLRWDAMGIHRFNVYLIRAFFWSVLFVGIADSLIAFMRVEGFLSVFFAEDTTKLFAKSRWVAPYIHIPLVVLGFVVAAFTRTLGFTWLALLIVAAELLIVVSRFVFSYEQALMGDLVRYWYAALFLFASAYTLFEEGHVRVDVLYAGFGRTTRGFLNAFGSIVLGMSTTWVILTVGFNGKTSIINSPIINFEISQAGGVGMFIKYQMAVFLGIFAITMLIQFVSYFLEAMADKRDEPGHREIAPAAH
ncbi:TRAP transporter small permease subunit [Aliiroseovarius sp. KMU-50]|uniref:TRAP transporter small permease protein n=1 Tax=Aliiroseovarius salicola TaxID=3009082 RepID=A0ABT4VY06_9RHOB|nr:TRAP transporter small permease subunit [Aliiroseovarius sp. KMU-50]MDA5093129.1 TRAP transporter small permease subunit [Aliiroseovarius sp. KMU-50]